MPKLPQYKVFHIDPLMSTEHFTARLESECPPYMRVVALIPYNGLFRVVCEARD